MDIKKRNVIVQRNGSCVYVSFKGCSTITDFVSSVDIRSCRINGEKVGIHNGFCERHKSLKDEVWYGVLENCMSHNITDVVFTGHSAGGSLAQIGALFSSDLMDDNIKLHCYTYGSPKVGDACFKDAIEEVVKDDKLVRIETFYDIVCLLPMQQGFQHVGKLLILGGSQGKPASHDQFFHLYHNEYLEFVKELKVNNLMNKQSIIKMIDEHSCDSYSDKIINMIQDLMVTKLVKNK